MKLTWLGYLVYSFDNCAMKLCIETRLTCIMRGLSFLASSISKWPLASSAACVLPARARAPAGRPQLPKHCDCVGLTCFCNLHACRGACISRTHACIHVPPPDRSTASLFTSQIFTSQYFWL